MPGFNGIGVADGLFDGVSSVWAGVHRGATGLTLAAGVSEAEGDEAGVGLPDAVGVAACEQAETATAMTTTYK